MSSPIPQRSRLLRAAFPSVALLAFACSAAPQAGVDAGTTHDSGSDAGSPANDDAGVPRDDDAGISQDADPRAPVPAPAYGIFQLYGDEYAPFRRDMGFSPEQYWDFVDEHAKRLDVHFTRTNTLFIWGIVEPEIGAGWAWDNETFSDATVRAVYAPKDGKDMDILLVLEPGRSVRGSLEHNAPYPTGREAEYQRYVRAVVERYDGDGVDDADGNVRVRNWQVMNEPFISLGEGLVTTDELASIIELTATAIRDADPTARVVLGDMGSKIAEVVPKLAGRGLFDAVDTHFWWFDLDTYEARHLPMLRRLLDDNGYEDAEIWMCEFGTYRNEPIDPFGDALPRHSEEDQARTLVKAMVANRAAGASRILWNNLVGWYRFGGDAGSIFNFMGLVSGGTESGDDASDLGKEVIAYGTYQRLIAKTETDVATLVGERRDLASSPARVFEFRRLLDDRSFFIAWSDGDDAEVRIPWSSADAVVASLLPTSSGSFDPRRVARTGGEIIVTASDDPVIIE